MITLIGHGYIGDTIAATLKERGLPFWWINHKQSIPDSTTVVINAAGYTGSPNVDACEIYKEDTIAGNVLWPLHLESMCGFIPVVHISSGCIYSGYKDGGWLETDKPNFSFDTGSFYSGSKALGQELLQPYMGKSYLLRIRMPFGNLHHPKNFLTKMVKYQKLISYENSLSHIDDVADVAIQFALNRPEPGIYNLCNPGASNAREIVGMMGIQKEWFTEEEFKAATNAPRSNCVLNVDKLTAVHPLKPVGERLREAIDALNSAK